MSHIAYLPVTILPLENAANPADSTTNLPIPMIKSGDFTKRFIGFMENPINPIIKFMKLATNLMNSAAKFMNFAVNPMNPLIQSMNFMIRFVNFMTKFMSFSMMSL
uniref:Uncharacterized protein n=2 Tax=Candidatus Kentrum sp. TUN TaxID=2126343 RepID=A0A450ZP96_9GAMM|nr:MAG: hypothetical protein BECKTUN1418D_GA0071000_103423 [Candidatus Kentron sp. TUN]